MSAPRFLHLLALLLFIPQTQADVPGAKSTASGPGQSAEQLFNGRFTQQPEQTISGLRALHLAQPGDWPTRYYLATVLIENAGSDEHWREAAELLEGAETIQSPAWLAPWSLARRYEMVALSLQRLTAKGMALSPAQKSQFIQDAELSPMLSNSLGRIDAALAPVRQIANGETADLTGDELREDLYALKNLLTSRWSYVSEKQRQTGRSLDEILQSALAEVRPRMGRRESGDVLRRFVSALLDGHAVVRVSDGAYQRALPFRVEETPEGLIIAEATPDSTLKAGDRLLQVNALDVSEALRQQEQLCVGSTVAGRKWNAIRALPAHWDANKPYAVSFERNGQKLTTELKTCPVAELPWLNLRRLIGAEGWLDAKMISPSTGYLRVATWAPMDGDSSAFSNGGPYVEKFRSQIDASMAKVKGASDLVLDLRGNGGGSDALCAWLASYFVPNPMHIYVLRYRQTEAKPQGDGFRNAERQPATYPRRSGTVLPMRLWVLVDGGCFSATDTFLNILTRNIPERVTLIGRSPSGGIGGPQSVGTLRNTRAEVTVSTCKAFAVSGDLLEGAPAKVDVPVQWTRADLTERRDPDLETALNLIRNK